MGRDACYDTPVPAATATFSPNGRCGDFICDGSLMLEVYSPAGVEIASVGVVREAGARGVMVVPFWAGLRGGAAKDERVSETEFDALDRPDEGLGKTATGGGGTNRRFLFGMSGEVLFDLSAPLTSEHSNQ